MAAGGTALGVSVPRDRLIMPSAEPVNAPAPTVSKQVTYL